MSWHVLIVLLAGMWLGMAALTTFALVRVGKVRYERGWFEGRLAMMLSFREAYERGMSPFDWLEAEVQRDVVRMMEGPPDR